MQFSQRSRPLTANKSVNVSENHRKLSAVLPWTKLDPQEQAAPSAARLAAEAAFASPSDSDTQNGQAQIIVRRARNLALVERPAEVVSIAVEQSAVKEPRVFRVDNALAQALTPASAAPALSPVQITDTQPTHIKVRRRRAQAQRPGPVVVVQMPAKPAPMEAPTPTASPELTFEILKAELACFTPILTAIEKAQAFQFIDNRFDRQYQRLSKQADRLLNQLKSAHR